MPVIFISHTIADKPVIDDLFDLLQMGCDLRRKDIFCSSVEGAGIETGADFLEWIQDHLDQSKIIILFLTPNYYTSKFCLAEMGAAWSLSKAIFPILVPGMERDAGLVLIGRQAAVVDETGLDDLRDLVAEHCPTAGKATSRWSLKKEQFLRNFRAKVKSLPQPQLVDRSKLEEEKQKIATLEKLKDHSEVARIKEQFLPKEEKYERLVKDVQEALSDLSIVEVR